MGRQLTLTKSQLTAVNFQYLGAFRLRVEARDANNSGADPHVFLFNMRPLDPHNNTPTADFLTVASPVDMAEYPIGEPNSNTPYPIFRSDVVELDFRAVEQADEAWTLIVTEVTLLLRILDRMEQLVPVVELTVGTPDDTPNSESSSLSVN